MLASLDRATIVHFLLGLGLVLGGWIFFVQPRLDELEQLETAIAEHRTHSSSFGLATSDQIAQQASLLRSQVARVDRKNAIAGDSAMLYARIISLAKQHDVRVQNLQGTPAPTTRQKTSVVISRVDFAVHGGYEQVANFIEALDEFGGYLRPSSLQIEPAQVGSEPVVTLRLECDALSFTLPAELAQMQGAADGDS